MHVVLGTYTSKEKVKEETTAALSVYICFDDDTTDNTCSRSEKYIIDAPKAITTDPLKQSEIAYADPLPYNGEEDPEIKRIRTTFMPQQMNAFGCFSTTFQMQKTPWYAEGTLKVLYANMGGQSPEIDIHPFNRSYCAYIDNNNKISHNYGGCAYSKRLTSTTDHPKGIEVVVSPRMTWNAGLQHTLLWCNHVMPKYETSNPALTPKLRISYELSNASSSRKGEMFTRYVDPVSKARTKTIELASAAEALKPAAKGLTGDTIDGSDTYQSLSDFTTQGLDFEAEFEFAGFDKAYTKNSKIVLRFPKSYRPKLADELFCTYKWVKDTVTQK